MRGVHHYPEGSRGGFVGSSPHARGPSIPAMLSNGEYGIIPACAGSMDNYRKYCREAEDHPRMRGVHESKFHSPFRNVGSSPHARGPLVDDFQISKDFRIIPACAGSILKKARKNAILEGITIPFHLTSQTQPLSTGNLPMPDVPVSPIPNDWQQWTICNWA